MVKKKSVLVCERKDANPVYPCKECLPWLVGRICPVERKEYLLKRSKSFSFDDAE